MLEPGTVLGGRYRLTVPIGEGGMGAVCEAGVRASSAPMVAVDVGTGALQATLRSESADAPVGPAETDSGRDHSTDVLGGARPAARRPRLALAALAVVSVGCSRARPSEAGVATRFRYRAGSVTLAGVSAVAALIEEMSAALREVPGVSALTLGGSRARGTQVESSDVDLGLYYDPESPPDIQRLRRLAQEFDDRGQDDLLTPIGGWGTWMNGGGWLQVRGTPVDWIYRDLSSVRSVINRAEAGEFSIDYYPGYPHGFVSCIYPAEVAYCRVVFDETGELSALRRRAQTYPLPLKRALVERFSWEAGFSLDNADKGSARGDVPYVAGCMVRAVGCMLQVIFALNERYCIHEKGALSVAEGFGCRPARLEVRVQRALCHLGPRPELLSGAVASLRELASEVGELVATARASGTLS